MSQLRRPAGHPEVGWPAYILKLRARLSTVKLPDVDPFVLLVTGSSVAEADVWRPVVSDCLAEVARWVDAGGVRPKMLRQGKAPGIDRMADAAGRALGYQIDGIKSEWRHWGRRSGILRNTLMVERYPYPDLCLAFFAGRSAGTADCAAQSRNHGIPTVPITVEDLYFPHQKS